MTEPVHQARAMWWLYEPVHAVTYYAPEPRAAFEAAGLRGFRRGYFAGRAAPLGAVDATVVTAVFHSFAPNTVGRAVPDVWRRAAPEQALRARREGAVAALRRLLGDVPRQHVETAAELLERAAAHTDRAGRVLAAANAALPRPDDALGRLWQAATTLREHRGDGHVAALVTAGVGACEGLVLRSALDIPRSALQPARGWSDTQWQQATDRAVGHGWIDPSGELTAEGLAAHRRVEAATDAAAGGPWEALGEEGVRRLAQALAPIAAACRVVLPQPNPIGLPVRA